MQCFKSKSFWRNSLILFCVSLLLGIWEGVSRQSIPLVFLSDLLFTAWMLFLLFGLFRLVQNLHVFTPAAFSFRFVHRLFRNEKVSGKNAKDEYYEYRSSRPTHPDAMGYIILGLCFLVLSLLMLAFI